MASDHLTTLRELADRIGESGDEYDQALKAAIRAVLAEVDGAREDHRRARMLSAVHGALADAGFSVGEIGKCEVALVERLTEERDGLSDAYDRFILLVPEVAKLRRERDEAREALIIVGRASRRLLTEDQCATLSEEEEDAFDYGEEAERG